MESLLTPELEGKVEASIQKECARAYSERKYQMGLHYRGFDDHQTARDNPPLLYKGCPENWTDLIDRHLATEAFERRSQANKQNRAQHPYPSLHGSRSYSQHMWTEKVRIFVKRCTNYVLVY